MHGLGSRRNSITRVMFKFSSRISRCKDNKCGFIVEKYLLIFLKNKAIQISIQQREGEIFENGIRRSN